MAERADVEIDGKQYRREVFGTKAMRVRFYSVRTARGHWLTLSHKAHKLRARIDAALDNPQTSD